MRFLIAVAVLPVISLFAQPISKGLDARAWINQGIEAYRHSQFEEAADDFQKAAELEPANPNAHLYVATACMMLYVPGSDFPDNIMYYQRAKTEFERALELFPNNPQGIASLAKLILQQAQGTKDPEDRLRQLDEARDWYHKLIAFDPRNKDAWSSLGVIDWLKCHGALLAARTQLGLRPDDSGPLPDAAVRQKFNAKYGPLIEEGIANLNNSLALDPNHEEALDYMSRFIRDRANLRDSAAAYRQDLDEAAQWEQKLAEARRTKVRRTAKPG